MQIICLKRDVQCAGEIDKQLLHVHEKYTKSHKHFN